MTERLFESNGFWEEVYPNEDRRSRVKSFVDGVSSGLERLEKVLLIRFGNGAEKLYLFVDGVLVKPELADSKLSVVLKDKKEAVVTYKTKQLTDDNNLIVSLNMPYDVNDLTV